MIHPIRLTLAAALFSLAVPASAAVLGPSLQERLALDDGPYEVIITLDTPAALPLLDGLVTRLVPLQELPMAGAVATRLQIDLLSALPGVKSVYLNERLEYSNFTSGEITGGHYVHDHYGVTGTGVTVAVLDSGIDALHQDLAFGSKTIENVKIVGDLDLLGGITYYLEGQPNTDTSSGHGSHVAGTVAGSGAASATDARRAYYHDGIAPGATLVGLGAGEAIAILHALLGFDYALANQERLGIDVITNSWGGGDGAALDPNNPINLASYEAYRRGMVVLFAASNSGPAENTLNQYAIAPWVINVAAGTPTKALADFSSRGVAGDPLKHPDITAPGSGIVSTRAIATPLPALEPVIDPEHPEYAVFYAGMSGTSMATPFVAGAAALLLEANPELSPDQVEEILTATADAMPGYAFHEVGAGYIDVREAVEVAQATVGERAAFLAGDVAYPKDAPDGPVTEEQHSFSGRLGPSFNNLEVATHSITVDDAAFELHATLAWTGLLDADLYLVGPTGERVASAATTANPEQLTYTIPAPGTYTFEVTGYVTLFADYTLDVTVVSEVIE